MAQAKFLGRFPQKTLTVALMGAVVLFGVACGGGGETTPTPTPTPTLAPTATPPPTLAPTPTLTPTPSPTPVDHVAEGKQLYLAKGCAVCHGQDAEGTAIAPALPGHNKQEVLRQVRNPVGTMPSFSIEQISDDELEKIADYFESLALAGEHIEPVSMEDALVIHHWMALYALESDNVAEAEHHIGHILELVTDAEHKARMEEALELLQAGELHDASHEIEEMLAGTADPELSMQNLHLELALAALEADDPEDAKHHLQHFIELASGDSKARAEEAIALLEQANLHDAKHEVEELLGQPSPTATPDLSAEGRQLFSDLQCIACHKINGEGGVVGPSMVGLFGSEEELTTGEKVTVDHEYLEESILNPAAKVVKGYSAIMPQTSLSHEQLDALIAFIKSLAE